MHKNNAFCSICTVNYSFYAGVLNESLRKAGHQETHYVLVVDYDEKYKDVVDNFGFEPVFLSKLAIPKVDELIERYSAFEMANILKPFFFEWLLKKHKEIDYLVYLDTDIYVYSPFNEIFDYFELNSKISIAITPHLSDHKPYEKTSDYSLERLFMLAGLYNGGFYAIKNDKNAMIFLNWQKIKLFNYGYDGPNAQMFVDQKILDFAPVLFEFVAVYRNEGYNVGHWNYNSNPVKKTRGTYFAGKKRLVFFHFSGLKINETDIAKRFLFELSLQDKPALQIIASNYQADLERNGYDKIKDIPYGFQERYNKPPTSLINPLLAKSIELEEMRGEFEKQAESSQQRIEHLNWLINTKEQEGAARERDLAQAVIQSKQDLEGLLRHTAAREKELGEQLLRVQHDTQNELRRVEQALTEQLLSGHREWAQAEKALNQEIAGLQSEIQAANHAQQMQAQQHGFELTTKQDALNRLIQTCADLEAQLKAQILSEQENSLQLRQTIAEVKKKLAITHASLSWRLTAPLRQMASFIAPRKGPGHSSSSPEQSEPTVSESQPTKVQPTSPASMKPIMLLSAPAINLDEPAIAATLDELLARHGQSFIHCAYQTLLGRDPDAAGLTYYLARLRTGIPKIQVLGQLRRSEEGKAYAADLPRLDAAIRRYRWAHKAIIGWLVRLFVRVEGNNATERKLRGLESQLFLLGEENMRRFNQMEKALIGLHHLVVDQLEQIKAVVAVGGSTAQGPIQPSESKNLKQLLPCNTGGDSLTMLQSLETIGSHTAGIFAAIKEAISNAYRCNHENSN
jgi:hypothetical protein